MKILYCLVIAGSHLQYFSIQKFIAIPFPDFDDLLRVRTFGPFDHTQKPVSLLDPGTDVFYRVFEKHAVIGSCPLGLPQVVPGFIEFDLFGCFESRVFASYLKYLYTGRIKGTKAGKGWKVLKSELHQFLKGENGN